MSGLIATRQGGLVSAVATLQAQPSVIAAGLRGPRGVPGSSFKVDITGLLANRSLYDGEDSGFVFLATDTGELYVRESLGGWSAGVPFKGDPGATGAAGADGISISITTAVIDVNGHLILTYSNAVVVDAGLVVGADGAQGIQGATGAAGAAGANGISITAVNIDGSNHLIISYSNATTSDAGLLPSGGGSSAWGGITGTLSNQADLVAVLNGKATSAQGAKADTAVQPGALATVATTGAYASLSGLPTIPTTAAQVGAIASTEKGAASGVATLDAGSKIPLAQLPATAITDTSVVVSQAAMLALTAQTGDVAVRTDINTSFILTAEPASTLGNWQELLSPAAGGGAAVGSATPQALGTATPGVSTSASRQDHVHAMPTAANVGAATTAQGALADTAVQPAALAENAKVSIGLASTGIRSGGLLTINADPAKFDVSAGSGWVVSHPTGLPSVLTEVVWSAFTAQVITNLATSFATDIAINSSGVLLQQNSYSDIELRSVILLGGLDHSNNTSIVNTFPIQKPVIAVASNVADLAKAVGDINLQGNVFSPNGANLFLNKSAGEVYSYGRNNALAPSDPSKVTTPQQTALSFGYVFNNGGGFGTFVPPGTSINPSSYDNGTGTLAVVANNKWTIQRVLFFANANKTFVQYGTQEYNSKADALASAAGAAFVALPGIRTAMVRGYIVLKKGTTALSSVDNAFLESDKFGSVAGLTSGTVTGVTGTAPIVSSGGAAPAISIDAATTLAAGSMSAADKTKLDGVATGAQVNVATNIGQGTLTTTTIPLTSSTGTGTTLPAATTLLAGLQSAADKTKLDGVATGATANATDAALRDRATHTGTQAQSTVTNLTTDLAAKITNPMTTAADLIVGGASGVPARLAKGAALQVLRVNAGATALEYADPASGGGTSLSIVTAYVGTAKTLALADINTVIDCTSATAVTITIPPQASVTWTADAEIHVRMSGAGLVSIAVGAGVTVPPITAPIGLAGQGAIVTLKRRSSNVWAIIGATAGGPGDVVGPASTVDSAVALYDGTTGKLLKAGLPSNAIAWSPVITESTTARTLGLTGAGAYIRFTNAAASTCTVAPQASVVWLGNTEISVRCAGAGGLTLAPGAGVTLNAPSGGTLVMTNAMSVTLKRVASDAWDVVGQTVAV
jgi:hypothetical protein